MIAANGSRRTVEEQLALVLDAVRVLPTETRAVREAARRTLAEPATAAHDIPLFDNSAMDGFAVRAADVAAASAEHPVVLRVVADLPAEVLQDPIWEQTGHVRKGRDGCRVPLPWTTGGPSYGFGPGGAWLPQPASFAAYAVEAQSGVAGSTLELYRTALRLRRKLLGGEELEWTPGCRERVLDFRRGEGWRCVANLGTEAVAVPPGEVLLSSAPLPGDGGLPPDTTVWLA